MTDASRIAAELVRAFSNAPSTDAAIRAGLALVLETQGAALDQLVAAAGARATQDDDEGTVARMIEGAALARRAALAGDIARGPVDDVVAALDVLASMPATPDRAARFAPLGAFVVAGEGVPAFVDMRVADGVDDVVATWTSGAAALRHILATAN